jgi:hypothetical protein
MEENLYVISNAAAFSIHRPGFLKFENNTKIKFVVVSPLYSAAALPHGTFYLKTNVLWP